MESQIAHFRTTAESGQNLSIAHQRLPSETSTTPQPAFSSNITRVTNRINANTRRFGNGGFHLLSTNLVFSCVRWVGG
jgi:hypothetical protein